MKKSLQYILQIGIAAVLLVGASIGVSYAQIAPPSGGAPTGQPPTFLNVSATSQAKAGWLSLGTTSLPTATLDVVGTALANSLIVGNNATVQNKLLVGTANPQTVARLEVGGSISGTTLAGTGEREVCADTNGVLVICTPGTTPPPPPAPECSDGIDNDRDGWVDIDDRDCWLDPTDRSTYDPNGISETGTTVPPITVTTAPGDCSRSGVGHGNVKCSAPAELSDGSLAFSYEIEYFNPDLNNDQWGEYSSAAAATNTWRRYGVKTYPGLNQLGNAAVNQSGWDCSPTQPGPCPFQSGGVNTYGGSAYRMRGVILDASGNVQSAGPWSRIIVNFVPPQPLNVIINPAGMSMGGAVTSYRLTWDINTADHISAPFLNTIEVELGTVFATNPKFGPIVTANQSQFLPVSNTSSYITSNLNSGAWNPEQGDMLDIRFVTEAGSSISTAVQIP